MDADKKLPNEEIKQGDWPEDLWITNRQEQPEPQRPDNFRTQDRFSTGAQMRPVDSPPMRPRRAMEPGKPVAHEPMRRTGTMRNRAPLPPPVPPRKRKPQAPRKKIPLGRIFFSLVIGLLLLASLILLPSLILKNRYGVHQISRDAAAAQKADAILVFGAGIYEDGTATPVLRDRVAEGAALYFKGAGKKLLLSGDHGQKGHDEVKAMKQVALEEGVPEEAIFLDHAGFSTWDSLYRAKHIFGAEKLCLVSQGYHLYRASYFADKLGIQAWGVAAEKQRYRDQIWQESREVLARVKAVFTALFKPQAEILGSAIDLTGDGRVTWD